MNNEFKKIKNNEYTRYVLENASSGGTSSGSVASVSMPIGSTRKRGDNILAQEADKKTVPVSTPRNFVAKNAKTGGAGQHKDKKKAEKQGNVKHRKPFAEQGVAEEGYGTHPSQRVDPRTGKKYVPPKSPLGKGVAEGFNGEYDDEAGMAHTNLLTSARAVMGLLKTIDDKDNLPEWVQEKIAKAEMMLVGVWDYLQSQKEQGIDPQQDANETYGRHDRRDAYQRDYDSSVSGMGDRQSYAYSQDGGGNDERHDLDPSDWYIVKDGKMYKTSVYPRQEQEAIARGYSRTKEEAKSKADNVAEGERTMSRAAKGNEKYGKDGMKALAKAGRDGASDEKLDAIRDRHDNYNEGLRDPKDNPCWKGYKPVGTKKKGGKTVPNCVPKESVDSYFESLRAKVEELAKK